MMLAEIRARKLLHESRCSPSALFIFVLIALLGDLRYRLRLSLNRWPNTRKCRKQHVSKVLYLLFPGTVRDAHWRANMLYHIDYLYTIKSNLGDTGGRKLLPHAVSPRHPTWHLFVTLDISITNFLWFIVSSSGMERHLSMKRPSQAFQLELESCQG